MDPGGTEPDVNATFRLLGDEALEEELARVAGIVVAQYAPLSFCEHRAFRKGKTE